MHAVTEVEVGVDSRGHTVVRRMRCEVPLLVRVIDDPGRALSLAMVNGAAGPLGGDHLRMRLVVSAGAHVCVRSVAAQLAQPGPRGEPSTAEIDLVVGEGATLDWAPEPLVSVAGSDHRTTIHLAASASAHVVVREVVSLGRHGEPPGRLALRQRVTIDGEPVLDHETTFGSAALAGPGAHGPARTVTSVVTIASELPPSEAAVDERCVSATFHVSPRCALSVSAAT